MSITLLNSPTTTPISQGAEAKVYKAFLGEPSGEPILLKWRFSKHYRHPNLDVSLTKARIGGEARALMKCLKSGVNVPGIRLVNASEGFLGIEWIEGSSVRKLIPGAPEDPEECSEDAGDEDDDVDSPDYDPLVEYKISAEEIMSLIGQEIAKMHKADIIHGDLTTSNMMLRRLSGTGEEGGRGRLVLIDFGLAYHSTLVEDKAVDLYVLERAFASTHPESEKLFQGVLDAYAHEMGKSWDVVKKRLDDVRLRGRKRSMVG